MFRGRSARILGTFPHVTSADFDDDGNADVFGVNSAGDLWWYPNDGWGTFKHLTSSPA